MDKLKLETIGDNEIVEGCILECQKNGHIQQVAFSTYHNALTQICFTCGKVRTSIKRKELKNGISNR